MTRANLPGLADMGVTAPQMGDQFNAEEWNRIAPAERVRRCRLFAHQASVLAVSAGPNMERPYLDIAHDWEKLAEDIEAEQGRTCLLVTTTTTTKDVLR